MTKAREGGLVVGLAVLSCLTLTYEVVQTRVFSYSLHPALAFTAIAIAMLGFGLGATVLQVMPGLRQGNLGMRAGWACLALAVSMLVVNAFFARTSDFIVELGTLNVRPLWAAIVLLPCILPYFLSGLVTAIVLDAGLARIGRVYFWNLGGSALGCVLAIPLLRPVGAERLVVITAAAAAVAAALFAWNERRQRWISLGTAAACAALVAVAGPMLPFQPETNEAIIRLEKWDEAMGRPELEVELTEWDPLGRIDVVKHGRPRIFVTEPTGYRSVTIDGGAMTMIIQDPRKPGWGKAIFEESLYGAAYHLRKNPDVLVIGIGGGTDIDAALHWDARSVTGVEISLSTLRALTGPYARFAGWPEHDDRVTWHHSDGRSFVKSTERRFDIVQLSGVDTFTMHSTGSMVLAEDYLYTTEAFSDFLSVLKPGGVLSVLRFGEEGFSLSAIAASTLRDQGIDRPEDHIITLVQNKLSAVLVKREPFTAEEVAAVREIEQRRSHTRVMVPHYDQIGLELGAPVRIVHPEGPHTDERYVRFFEMLSEGREDEALLELEVPFIVPTDDRPYYMLGSWINVLESKHPTNMILMLVATTSIVTALAALVLILLPAAFVRRQGSHPAGAIAAVIVFFFGLGAGFMILEVGLIQRMVVFVGTPGASVSVVLASILVSSGIGARVTEMVPWSSRTKLLFALGGLILTGALHAFGSDVVLDAFFGLPMWGRSLVAALLLALPGFFMGWFFPTGLSMLTGRAQALVPWAIAVNGFASVIGSLATLPLGMVVGLRSTFLVSLAGYVLATAVILLWSRSRRE